MFTSAFLQIFHYLQGKQDRHALGADKSDHNRLVQMRTYKQMHGDKQADMAELKHRARRYSGHFGQQAEEQCGESEETICETYKQVAGW